MRLERADDNPFDLTKASDFSDSQILDYWVDIAGAHGGLLGILKPRLTMPMLLLGGKGSGKTHLMRYCSAPVQAARFGQNLRKAVNSEGYLGVYIKAEGLNVGKFTDKGQDEQAWSSVFAMYLEMWLATSLLQTVQNLLSINAKSTFDEATFCNEVSLLFDEDVSSSFSNLVDLLNYLTRERKNIDLVVNNAAITKDISSLRVKFSMGSLAFGIPKILASTIPELSNATIVYLIDEAENFTGAQQKFLNSLIRYRSGNATLKIGARLYGIRTYETIGSGEPIKQNSEYEKVELDSFLREHSTEYEKFVSNLVLKRLHYFKIAVPGVTDETLGGFFEELKSENFYEEVGLSLVGTWDKEGEDRPYVKRLKKHVSEAFDLNEPEANALLAPLILPESPFLEKANTFRFYRKWPVNLAQAKDLTKEIGSEVHALRGGGRSAAPAYAQMLSHFDSDILAQLYRDCKRKVPYAGLKTLIHLSQGVPRNLLGILKQIYRRSLFAGETPFSGGLISISAQSEGVFDSASWFWDDAQPDSYGAEVREGVEALAILFRTIRYSEKPSECDLCTFSVNLDKLTENSRLVVRMAQNWSYLIEMRSGASNRNDDSLDAKFQLGPILAPRWGISAHRRGSIELKPELANALFDRRERAGLPSHFRRRVSEMLAPGFFASKHDSAQEKLF